MSIFSAIASAWALLIGMALISLGNGLQGTLLGLRATIEGFPTVSTGMVMAGYSMGFLGGSALVPKLVERVGHIRVFAALASLASTSVLLHSLLVEPGPWLAFRLVTGFCYAGIYIVAESWLNDRATNQTRGQLLSAYMVVVMGGMGAGQLLLNLADPAGAALFIVVSVLVSFALVPMSLSGSPAPAFEAPEPVGIGRLYRSSPLGVFGSLVIGVSYGALWGMAAVYARARGMSVAEVSVFVAMPLVGAMVLQWPIGWLSDRLDRRRVITVVTFIAAAAALVIPAAQDHRAALLALAFVLGGMAFPLYSLCVAHTNDHLPPHRLVGASATLVLVQGIGLTVGPVVAAKAMDVFGPAAMFWVIAGSHLCVGSFALYRMTRRESVPLAEQREYAPSAPRGTTVATAVASRTVRDHRDRDLARWSTL